MVERFIDENAAFLGASSATLAEPYVYSLAGAWVLVFQETTPGGIPVRGASLRAVVFEDGSLGWIKAFLARGAKDPEGTPISREEAESAAAAGGGEVASSRLELGFFTADPASAAPIWSVWVKEQGGQPVEHIVSATLGSVLTRRIIVKHFDGGGGAEDPPPRDGTAQGFSPDLDNIFLSPQTTNLGMNPLRGALIRTVESHIEIALTNDFGDFALPEGLSWPSLNASLETGTLGREGYRPLLKTIPLLENRAPAAEAGGYDSDQDRVPDQTRPRGADWKFAFGFFSEPQDDLERKARSWSLASYTFARKVITFSGEVIANQLVRTPADQATFLPIQRLNLKPIGTEREGIQEFRPGMDNQNGREEDRDFPQVLTSLKVDAGGVLEDALPTLLQHEVGHHIFYHMTHSLDSSPPPLPLEEGVADVLTGWANDEPRMGYREARDGARLPTRLGFTLRGHEAPDFRHPVRVGVAEGFWELRKRLAEPLDPKVAPESTAGQVLLFAWLGFNRVPEGQQRAFDNTQDLFEELLEVDDTPKLFGDAGDGRISNGTPHWQAITDVFRGRLFFDGPFVRGDANIDQKMDLSDAIAILNFLFGGKGAHDCKNALDADDDGKIDITDAVRLLSYLFQGGRVIPDPFTGCGIDSNLPGTDGNLGCREFSCPF